MLIYKPIQYIFFIPISDHEKVKLLLFLPVYNLQETASSRKFL